jgi:hypothetical protein
MIKPTVGVVATWKKRSDLTPSAIRRPPVTILSTVRRAPIPMLLATFAECIQQ